MTRNEALKKAENEIERKTYFVLDFCANQGQMFDNIKHMAWFKTAIANELQKEKI